MVGFASNDVGSCAGKGYKETARAEEKGYGCRGRRTALLFVVFGVGVCLSLRDTGTCSKIEMGLRCWRETHMTE